MKTHLSIGSRIWIKGKEVTYLGEGRINLLEKIEETGSINIAAKEMGMSYKKALKLLDTMNEEAKESLVVRVSGGKGGGGTVVTEKGKKAIVAFRGLTEKCNDFLNKEFQQLLKEGKL